MQLVDFYLPIPTFPLWPCLALLAIFVPLTVWHEVHWRRTLDAYARIRLDAGASDPDWPAWDVRVVLAAQPWLLVVAAGLLTAMVTLAVWALAQWPHRAVGFDIALNYFDLPWLWATMVAGIAAVIGTVAIAIEALHSPWATVAECVRHAIYAKPEDRARLLALALSADPGLAADRAAEAALDPEFASSLDAREPEGPCGE